CDREPLRRDARLLPLVRLVRDPRRGDRVRDPALGGDRLLGPEGRPPAGRAAVARLARDPRRRRAALPRTARLHALPPAGVPRGRARAPARDQGDREAPRRARAAVLGLRRGGRRRLPRLPRLHDAPAPGVREVGPPGRAVVAGLPLLRDPGRERARPAPGETPAPPHHALLRLRSPPDGGRADADPGEAGRGRPRARGRDPRALRAPGLHDPRRPPRQGLARARRDPLRRAPREAVLRRAGRLHHLRAHARLRARGGGRGGDGAPDDRRHEPRGRGPRLPARRARARDAEQPRPRLRLARVGRARDRALVPRWARLRARPGARTRRRRPDGPSRTRPGAAPPGPGRTTSATIRERGPGAAVAGGGAPARPPAMIVLASTSPQRRAILDQLRIPYEAVAPAFDEGPDGDPVEHAAGKARSVDGGGRPVLGVDTIVSCAGETIGKPRDAADA